MVVLKIPKAPNQPVRFGSEALVRIDSQKRKLKDYPEHARKLWASFDTTTFEAGFALQDVDGPRVLHLIDFSSCFDKLGIALPSDQTGILSRLCDERLIVARPGARFDITNLGAILFAKNLGDFGRLGRKSIRVVRYSGDGRFDIQRQWEDAPATRGYAMSFEAAVAFVNSQVEQNEPIEQALRRKVKMYPEIAIRELVGNAIIHQDFSIRGTGLASTQSAKATRIINETLDTGQIKPVNPEASRKFMRYVPSWC